MQYTLEFGIALALILLVSVAYYAMTFMKTMANINRQKQLSVAKLSSMRDKRSRRHKIITMSAIREEAAEAAMATKVKAQQALTE